MSRPHQLLCAGNAFVDWIREGKAPETTGAGTVYLYRWRAFWLERNFSMIRRSARNRKTDYIGDGERMVFILGFWRSGTTLVHELLADMPGCCVPKTWQCMNPNMLLLTHKNGAENIVQRPMDDVMIGEDSPQEDEFALMAMGVPSLYRGFIDPRRFSQLSSLLDQTYWLTEGRRWIDTFEEFVTLCAKAQYDHFVVKSPNHIFRYNSLAKEYPKARFLLVLRAPEDLWRSNLKMWRLMVARYGLWRCTGDEIECFLAKALAAYGDFLSDLLASDRMPQIVFSYEGLVRNPDGVLPAISEKIGLGAWSAFETSRRELLLAKVRKPLASEGKRNLESLQNPEEGRLEIFRRITDLHAALLSKFESGA